VSVPAQSKNVSKRPIKPLAQDYDLNFIDPSKFIEQNNFIPQPSVLLSQTKPLQDLAGSGENLTEERFLKSRQKARAKLTIPKDANFVPGGFVYPPKSIPRVSRRLNSLIGHVPDREPETANQMPGSTAVRRGQSFAFTSKLTRNESSNSLEHKMRSRSNSSDE